MHVSLRYWRYFIMYNNKNEEITQFHWQQNPIFFTNLFLLQLDYIPRLMWQAQLQGNKTWNVSPTPECEAMCSSFSFFVVSSVFQQRIYSARISFR